MSAAEQFIALDLEMNQPSGKIIQIGVSIGRIGQPHAEYLTRKWYIDPGEPISAEIVALTGIDDDAIAANAVPCARVAAELSELLGEHPCFINPVTWGGGDSALLLELFRAQGIKFPHFGRRWVDVKTLYSLLQLSVGRNPAGGLSSAMGRYKLSFHGTAHRADVDAHNTLRFFFHLLDRQRVLEGIAIQAKSI